MELRVNFNNFAQYLRRLWVWLDKDWVPYDKSGIIKLLAELFLVR